MISTQLYCIVLLCIVREVERGRVCASILHSREYVFKVSHPTNPMFVCFVEWTEGAQGRLLSD